ncbi:Alpha/Beta hydrolase protein [Lophiotrema nucula]|uniref:Alpha/Beta hydrolase protein n=1 Tax=Lophiotrema nucula TaxID=690887 RepID=A0A6A5YVL3_9PLEO|nr:Alpha/Beta hydrolase protein [Lophiotrema nucula]
MASNIHDHGFVNANGVQLFYEREGNSRGRSILFIHGLGGTTNAYQTLVSSLQEFDLIRFDWSGHGRSTVRQNASIASYVEDCEAILEHLNLHDVAVVAHSMGGLVAFHLAAKRSDLIKRLILFGPVSAPLPELGQERTRARAETVRQGGMLAVADTVVSNALAKATLEENLAVVGFAREMLTRQDKEGYAQACYALAAAEAPEWSRIRASTTIVSGKEDKVSTVEIGEKIRGFLTHLSNIEVVAWAGVGHWHMLEAPAKAATVVRTAMET